MLHIVYATDVSSTGKSVTGALQIHRLITFLFLPVAAATAA